MTGIYVITSPTNKIYVGQSYDIEGRIYPYKTLSCKTQPRLYRSLNKHGWNKHKFEIGIIVRDDFPAEWLTWLEQFFMDYYRNEGYELLNLKEAGPKGKASEEVKQKLRDAWKRSPERGRGENHPLFGTKASEESRKKMSESHKGIQKGENHPMFGRKHSKETKNKWSETRKGKNVGADNCRSKSIIQYDLNGKFIKEWGSIGSAGRELKIHSIWACCKGKTKHAGGYIWRYKVETK